MQRPRTQFLPIAIWQIKDEYTLRDLRLSCFAMMLFDNGSVIVVVKYRDGTGPHYVRGRGAKQDLLSPTVEWLTIIRPTNVLTRMSEWMRCRRSHNVSVHSPNVQKAKRLARKVAKGAQS